ncbi:hypothetical protein [Pseudomonas fluorescens]|jgi:hypothetical protein|uniref:hypothetical protein n=1 Tax=Pseudomonas fluorescens TaxID=294 RepID=UPI00054B6888|nr:hypothetical protein [Pseudomonas fluorescens]KII30046.1 hypothetical protein RY26_25290 [Pseudomonas fluorescens]
MAALHLVPPAPAQPLSILTEEFPKKLATFNDLTRDMREAGIVIKALVLADNKIFVDPDSLELLARRFGHELRSMRCNAEGRLARNTASIRGVGVVWFTLVKEQDK